LGCGSFFEVMINKHTSFTHRLTFHTMNGNNNKIVASRLLLDWFLAGNYARHQWQG